MRSTKTIKASFPNGTAYGVSYRVEGCGYQPGVGVSVTVQSPEAYSFAGQIADAQGCISLDNFSVQGAGLYTLEAYQSSQHKADATSKFTL